MPAMCNEGRFTERWGVDFGGALQIEKTTTFISHNNIQITFNMFKKESVRALSTISSASPLTNHVDSRRAQSPRSNPPSSVLSAPKSSRRTRSSNHTSTKYCLRKSSSTWSRSRIESRFTAMPASHFSGNTWMTLSSLTCNSYTSTHGASLEFV